MSKNKKPLLEQTELAIQNILDGGDETITAIYENYREEFLRWVQQQYKLPEEDAVDIFQEAVIVFYKNVLKRKITSLNSSIKTYLFGICKKKMLKSYDKKSKFVFVEDMNDPLLSNIDLFVSPASELDEQKEVILEALDMLSDRCRKILHLFYYKRFSMEAIKERMGYNTEEVARTSKRKCMKKLKEILQKK